MLEAIVAEKDEEIEKINIKNEKLQFDLYDLNNLYLSAMDEIESLKAKVEKLEKNTTHNSIDDTKRGNLLYNIFLNFIIFMT